MRYVVPFSRTAVPGRRFLDPFALMQREMENMLENFARTLEKAPEGTEDVFFTPVVEAREDDKGLTIEVDLPGVDPDDVSVELSEGVLTIKAERRMDKEAEKEEEGVKYHIAERAYGTFLRRFTLPWEADEENIEASFDKGVLKVFVPRRVEEKKARKIAIRA